MLVGFRRCRAVREFDRGGHCGRWAGAVSAALAGYVSRTFVKSQEAAAAHLRVYFDQPLESSRYLAAERILTNLSREERAEVLSSLVQAIVAGPQPPAAPGVTLIPGQQSA